MNYYKYFKFGFFFIILVYAIFNARNFIIGPYIKIDSSLSSLVNTKERVLTIQGKAGNISYISLNNKEIKVDKDGNFSEKLLLYEGYNTIDLRAKDRFKKEVEKRFEIYYSPV